MWMIKFHVVSNHCEVKYFPRNSVCKLLSILRGSSDWTMQEFYLLDWGVEYLCNILFHTW